jgi:hypothetical protein
MSQFTSCHRHPSHTQWTCLSGFTNFKQAFMQTKMIQTMYPWTDTQIYGGAVLQPTDNKALIERVLDSKIDLSYVENAVDFPLDNEAIKAEKHYSTYFNTYKSCVDAISVCRAQPVPADSTQKDVDIKCITAHKACKKSIGDM